MNIQIANVRKCINDPRFRNPDIKSQSNELQALLQDYPFAKHLLEDTDTTMIVKELIGSPRSLKSSYLRGNIQIKNTIKELLSFQELMEENGMILGYLVDGPNKEGRYKTAYNIESSPH